MFKDDDDLFDSDDSDDLDLDIEDDDEDDDEDYEDWDDEDIIELTDHGYIVEGASVWGLAWICVSAVADTIHAHFNFWDNLRTDLAYRHNRSIDQSDFIGSVEAGIERL